MRFVSIRSKIIVGVIVSSILPAVFAFYIIFNNFSDILVTRSLGDEQHDVEMKTAGIEGFLDGLGNDVLFLSQISSLENYLSLSDAELQGEAKKEIQDDFVSFSTQRGLYYQIRYIDETGQEVVRVDQKEGEVIVVDEEDLQNKSGRYYFDDTIALSEGEVFVSPLDLNIENKEIENRGTDTDPEYVPVIRYGTPVVDESGVSRGVVITNVYAEAFLSLVPAADYSRIEGKQVFLINADGYFLQHPDEDLEWGFMFDDEEKTVFEYCPGSYNELFSSSGGHFYSEENDCYVTFGRVEVFELDQSENWILYSVVQRSAILEVINSILVNILFVLLVVLFIALLLGAIIFRTVLAPINRLRVAVEHIGSVETAERVEVNTGDEIGDFANALNEMIDKVYDARANLEEKVEERTRELTELNKFMVGREEKMIELKKEIEALKKGKTNNES